jgi:6-phosphogluconolactonase
MIVEILPDAATAARRAAAVIAAEAREAVLARGAFSLALSGGDTPRPMLLALVGESVPWHALELFQVDERLAPAGDPERNLTQLRECLLAKLAFDPRRLHAMPVEEPDLAGAASRYAALLERVAGTPPVLDLVHLGLGADGHTASLVAGDSALGVRDASVSSTGVYRNRRRMTLTYPTLNRARRILWLVTGAAKAAILARLRAGDPAIPAGRVSRVQALVVADREAAG